MIRPLDIAGILERAGADEEAPEGSRAFALAQVELAVVELTEALRQSDAWIREAVNFGGLKLKCEATLYRNSQALANFGGAK